MSATEPIPDELYVLAGEFVLGTLEPAEMRAVERQAAVMPALAKAIESWEWRLAPLARSVPPVPPPADLWMRVERSLGHAPPIEAMPPAVQPAPPPPDQATSCAEAGVLGPVTGVMGTLQATEVLKEVLGIGAGLAGRLLIWDALSVRFHVVRLVRDPVCALCGDEAAARPDVT